MDSDAVMHHLVELIDGDELLKRASVDDLVKALRKLADKAIEVFEGAPAEAPLLPPDHIPPLPESVPISVPPLPEVLQAPDPPPLPPEAAPWPDLPAPAPLVAAPKIVWTEEQCAALDQIDAWFGGSDYDADDGFSMSQWLDQESRPRFYALTGPAGVGKTTVMREVVRRYPQAALAAMTGKAALRLSELAGREATTLHKILYYPPAPGENVEFTRLREPPSTFVAIDECFVGTQLILTEYGWRKIGKIVNTREKLRVWSRNPMTGDLELKPVIRWLKKPAPTEMVHINATRTASKRDGRNIYCTKKHKILTPNGYVCAGDLRAGDRVIVRGKGLTREQRSILIGSLLGDGSTTREGGVRKGVQAKLMHGEEQLDYLMFKKRAFGSLASEPRSYPSGFEGGKPVWSFALAVTDDGAEIARETVYNGKKYRSGRKQWSPTDTFLSWIDEQALAVWFLDNGSLIVRGSSFSASLHTERFNLEDHRRFIRLLRERFGICARIQKARGEMVFLRFGKAATERLLEIVRKYSPSCMSWKTGVLCDYTYEAPSTQPQTTTARIRNISLFQPATRRRPNPSVYDIEVEGFHNYIASNVVVSNCSMMTPLVLSDLQRWGVRVLFVGDSFQLPPVITGKELQRYGEDYSVFSIVKGAELRTVMRNAGGVLRAATYVRETGEICCESGDGYEYRRSSTSLADAVAEYIADRDDHLLITWRNEVRMRANRLIRARLGHEGELPDEGEPVLIRRNGQGCLNGEIVECGGFEAGPKLGSLRTLWMRIRGGLGRILVSFEGGSPDKGGEFFDGGMPWIEDWRAYHIDLKKQNLHEPLPITFGYCLTAHSAQGSQARRTTVFLERGDDRSAHFKKATTLPDGRQVPFSSRWLYTATTRSKEQTLMIVGR